jgi:hypothetical protein
MFLIIACGLLWAYYALGSAVLLGAVWFLCLPFLWFSEHLGEWIGIPPLPGGVGSRPITKESPPILVLGFGWFILCATAALLFL